MPEEMTLENLYAKIEKLGHVASDMEKFLASQDQAKIAAAKKAEDEKKEDEKKEAKKASLNAAIKAAAEEEDPEKKAAILKAAMEDDDKKEAFGKPKHAESDEDKEKSAQIAAIIKEKKDSLISQILSANRIFNPTGVAEVEARLKTASITDIQKEHDMIKPFIAGIPTQTTATQQPFVPFYANITPADVDKNQLTASSPDSEFSKLSTKELMEMFN